MILWFQTLLVALYGYASLPFDAIAVVAFTPMIGTIAILADMSCSSSVSLYSYAKTAWRLAIVYTIGSLAYLYSLMGEGGMGDALLAWICFFHLLLFVIFMMAYKKGWRFCSLFSATWFCFWSLTLCLKIYFSFDPVYFEELHLWLIAMSGLFTALIFLASMTYLSIRNAFFPGIKSEA